jgi:hypothetical protein
MGVQRGHSGSVAGGLALTGVIGLQRAIMATLDTILAAGQRSQAQPIVWTLGFDGLTGKVHAVGDDTEGARATFDQWVLLTGARRRPERISADGRTFLVASRRHGSGRTEHVVVLRLELPPAARRPK